MDCTHPPSPSGFQNITDSTLAYKSYRKGIEEYLRIKNITDFTRFELSIKHDRPIRLEYDIEQPKEIKSIAIEVTKDIKDNKFFNYILIIGPSKSFYKVTEYEIKVPENVDHLDIKKISVQVSFYQDTFNYSNPYDDIVCNIRSLIIIGKNTIRIELLSYRHIQQLWSINHKVFLQIIISDKDIEIINPIDSLIKPVFNTLKNG